MPLTDLSKTCVLNKSDADIFVVFVYLIMVNAQKWRAEGVNECWPIMEYLGHEWGNEGENMESLLREVGVEKLLSCLPHEYLV